MTKRMRRRTASSGGAPSTQGKRRRDGNPGYAGYEYQIGVTVWAGLELMLAKEIAEAVDIEPRSHEDFEAAIKAPEGALLQGVAATESFELMLQAKTRSAAPWTSTAFADVLTGGAASAGDGRKRALQLLELNRSKRYVFVTNEAVEASLRPHVGDHLLDFDDEVQDLPPHARSGRTDAERAAIAQRLLICAGITVEVLNDRIGRLLNRHGHVPIVNHPACVHDLRERVRERMLGLNGGRWTKAELLLALARHGGAVTPTRAMARYVKPRSFDAILAQLENHHAVVIAGPSGTGKTLTADIVELKLRQSDPPFSVVGEERGPNYVRRQLTRDDPVLFHLRDPWGGNRMTPGADHWSGELPKLMREARSDRKFLITSRSDVLLSAGHTTMKDLAPHTVFIELEDYAEGRLAEIYDSNAGELTGAAVARAIEYREAALAALTRPYEIDRFMVALASEDTAKPRKLAELLANSQIDAISNVIADQIAPMGDDGVASAAIVWGLLKARPAMAAGLIPKLLRRMRSVDATFRPDVDGLLDFLVAGRNLRRDGVVLSFHHPRVADGLRLAFIRRWGVAEDALSRLANALSSLDDSGDDWGIETAIGLLRAVRELDGVELELEVSTHHRLDIHLQALTDFASGRPAAYEGALRDLAAFGSKTYVPSQLARLLMEGGPSPTRITWIEQWHAPSLAPSEIAALKTDPTTQSMIEHFVRSVLPFSRIDYPETIVDYCSQMAKGLEPCFFDALEIVADPGGPHQNIGVIVAGACAGTAPDYERVIERLARSEAEVDAWSTSFAAERLRAEEHEVDAVAADHILEEPGERYYNAREGMQAAVAILRARGETGRIAGHQHQRLLTYALANVISASSKPASSDELRDLLGFADGWARPSAWRGAFQHWKPELIDLLERELIRTDIEEDELRQVLVKVAARHSAPAGDPISLLVSAASATSVRRRLELVRDVMVTELEDDPSGTAGKAHRRARAERLADGFSGVECEMGRALVEVLGGDVLGDLASRLSHTAQQELTRLLPELSTCVAGPFACLLASAGIDPTVTAERLLATNAVSDGETALLALEVFGVEQTSMTLKLALGHARYPVRRIAMQSLAAIAGPADRGVLAARVACDCSADIRLAWANLMGDCGWPEAVDSLLALLGDTRDFRNDRAYGPGPHWPMFKVARAAGNALGTYTSLSVQALSVLISFARNTKSRDPFVACAALGALSNKQDDAVESVLLEALGSAGLDGGDSHRVHAQSAAWALLDRAIAGIPIASTDAIVRAACDAEHWIAAPLLMTVGILGGESREQLLSKLRTRGAAERLELVAVAASPAVVLLEEEVKPHHRALIRLSDGTQLGDLQVEEREAVTIWSESLSSSVDVEGTTAWLLSEHFSLPVHDPKFDPRSYDLPERLGVLTLRSLSPAREEHAGVDHGH